MSTHANPPPGTSAMQRRLLLQTGLAGVLQWLCPAARATASADDGYREISYYEGQRVRVPAVVRRVATTWEAQNSILAMLGAGERIVATTRIVRSMPNFRRFVPGIEQAVIAGAGAGDVNIEALLEVRPDVLFVAGELPPAAQARLQAARIPVVSLRYNALEAMVERTRITAEILGGQAPQRAQAFERYYRSTVDRVRQAVAQVPQRQRLKVFHAMGSAMQSSGRPSLNQDWMDIAGAVNVAEPWFTGASAGTVSIEQILQADPDVIVVMHARDAEMIRSDRRWRGIGAVKAGRVHVNPKGLFWWCRETCEAALQPLWLAQTLYPQAFASIDMRQETRRFYETFYGYRLGNEEVSLFLNPEN